MDIYEPTDGSTKRPLIIYLGTGSFLPRYINKTPTGAKDDSATAEMCRQFARKGYVVASISYRQGWNPTSQDVKIIGLHLPNICSQTSMELKLLILYVWIT